MPLESEPVATARELANVADRVAADQLGQFEDLGHGQDGALRCLLASGSPDAAGIAGEDLVLFGGGHQHCAQEPVGLAAIVADTPLARRADRHSRMVCVLSFPMGTSPRYGSMCLASSQR